jgi:hypothetical protein
VVVLAIGAFLYWLYRLGTEEYEEEDSGFQEFEEQEPLE